MLKYGPFFYAHPKYGTNCLLVRRHSPTPRSDGYSLQTLPPASAFMALLARNIQNGDVILSWWPLWIPRDDAILSWRPAWNPGMDPLQTPRKAVKILCFLCLSTSSSHLFDFNGKKIKAECFTEKLKAVLGSGSVVDDILEYSRCCCNDEPNHSNT